MKMSVLKMIELEDKLYRVFQAICKFAKTNFDPNFLLPLIKRSIKKYMIRREASKYF